MALLRSSLTSLISEHFLVDSYYEYMIKEHLLVGGVSDQYSKMYTAAIETARNNLFMPLNGYEGREYLVSRSLCFGLVESLMNFPDNRRYHGRQS